MVARSAFAAVGFVSALTDYRFKNRPLRQWFVSELPEALGSTTHDVLLVLNHLSARGDLDVSAVGVWGIGSGGTVAILAAQADSRITTLDVIDPWGDWADWLKNSPAVSDKERPKYVTKEFLQSVSALDPATVLPNLKTPNIRIQQNTQEPITPAQAKDKIAGAAPDRAIQVKYRTPQELLEAWKAAGLSGWVKQQLQPKAPTGSEASDRAQNTAGI